MWAATCWLLSRPGGGDKPRRTSEGARLHISAIFRRHHSSSLKGSVQSCHCLANIDKAPSLRRRRARRRRRRMLLFVKRRMEWFSVLWVWWMIKRWPEEKTTKKNKKQREQTNTTKQRARLECPQDSDWRRGKKEIDILSLAFVCFCCKSIENWPDV